MRIAGRKRDEIARIFAEDPRNSWEECQKMADLLIAEGIADTNELSLDRWNTIIMQATGRVGV